MVRKEMRAIIPALPAAKANSDRRETKKRFCRMGFSIKKVRNEAATKLRQAIASLEMNANPAGKNAVAKTIMGQ